MTIVSYAQNFEDVMLWRALKDVKNGFYIDVGANHPLFDSVTKLFYQNGWSGINIEPEFEFCKLLQEDRPHDLNLNMAISSQVGSIDFHVSSKRGWSTTDKKCSINLKDKNSFSETRSVKAISLNKLCEDYHVNEINFLKVDVEGAEKDVLESFSFDKIRPWICVIEATKPTLQIDVSIEWENILIESRYIFAYFDGVNKYYISEEKQELLKHFQYPPNVFDKFILHSQKEGLERINELQKELKELKEKNIENSINQLSVKEIMEEIKDKVKQNKEFKFKKTYEYSDFTKYHDIDFIEKLYKAILKREPNIKELQYYLELLKGGKKSKSNIISIVKHSKEGNDKGVEILGSKKRYIYTIVSSLPLIGYIFKFLITSTSKRKDKV